MLAKYDLSSLRVTAASGSALPGPLAQRWMDQFGDNLYNLYGSTEVAWATIATPDDLRAAPGTAGLPPRGTVVKIVDHEGKGEVPTGETGRVFVGNEMAFEGYTGGGGKDVYEGLLSSGDVGHFDQAGRLFIDGRDDEMIVSGGENVFPREVEDLLAGHDAVKEVAVIGVDDEDFGQRLKAFVVAVRGRLDRRGRGQVLREAEPRPLQGPARGRVPRLAAAQRHRQGAQARARLTGLSCAGGRGFALGLAPGRVLAQLLVLDLALELCSDSRRCRANRGGRDPLGDVADDARRRRPRRRTGTRPGCGRRRALRRRQRPRWSTPVTDDHAMSSGSENSTISTSPPISAEPTRISIR